MNTQLDAVEARGRSTRVGLRLVAVVAAVAAVAVVAAGTAAALLVGAGDRNETRVEFDRPEEAAVRLERALEQRGIAADITYLPALQTCAPGRYTAVDRRPTGISAVVGARLISVTLPPHAVRSGETFVLTWSVEPSTAVELEDERADSADVVGTVTEGQRSNMQFDIATGPVAPCQPVPAATR